MAETDFHALIAGEVKRTFNALDLAEAYADEMRKHGATVVIVPIPRIRRAA